jgi:endonuclease/exonuclease/phosphatase (EEP) superfamily protein YafD
MRWLLIIQLSSAFFFYQQTDNPAEWLQEFGYGVESGLLHGAEYSLVSWNIYKGAKKGLHQDLQNLIQSNDFTLVQEFLLNTPQQNQIVELDEYHWGFAKSFKDSGQWTGVTTISQWQPKEVVPLKSSDTEPFAGTPKMSLISKVPIEGYGELWVVNMHSLNFDPGHSSFKNQLNEVLTVMAQHKGPMVFAGDFNTWSSERRKYLLEKTQSLGLARVDIENPMGIFSTTLDHIFYRGIKISDYQLLKDINSSDHKPLRIQFALETLTLAHSKNSL